MKKTIIIIAITVVIAGGAGFFGGMKYGQSKTASTGAQRFAQLGQNANGQRTFTRGNGANGRFASGQIISKNDQSFTIQLPNNNGSQIVFYTSTTPVTKTVDGASQDLINGVNVIVTGTKNSDGSVTAQSIQIRPDLPQTPTNGQNSTPSQNTQN